MKKKINFYLIFCASMSAYWFIVTILPKSELNLKMLSTILLGLGGVSFVLKWIQIKYTMKEYILQAIFFIPC